MSRVYPLRALARFPDALLPLHHPSVSVKGVITGLGFCSANVVGACFSLTPTFTSPCILLLLQFNHLLDLFLSVYSLSISFKGYAKLPRLCCGMPCTPFRALPCVQGANMGDKESRKSDPDAAGKAQWSASSLESQSTQPVPEKNYTYRRKDLTPFYRVSFFESTSQATISLTASSSTNSASRMLIRPPGRSGSEESHPHPWR